MQRSMGDLLPNWTADTPVTADNLKQMVEAIRTALNEVDLRLSTSGGTVDGDLNVTKSLKRNGNVVYDTGNKPKAEEIGAVPLETNMIDLLHLSKDVYYPIVLNNTTNPYRGAIEYELIRYAHQDGKTYPNIYAKMIFRGSVWGLNSTYFHMNYSSVFNPEKEYLIGQITEPTEDNRLVVYLMGGYTYVLTASGPLMNTFNIQIIETETTIEHTHVQPFNVSGATPLEYGVYEVVNQNGFEITGSKYMRLKDTYLTDDGERVYSPNNLPNEMKTAHLNEANFANDFAMDNGELYVNYRNAEKPITKYLLCNGKMTGELANLSAKAIYEGDKRVYSPNNKPSAADVGAVFGKLIHQGSNMFQLTTGKYLILGHCELVGTGRHTGYLGYIKVVYSNQLFVDGTHGSVSGSMGGTDFSETIMQQPSVSGVEDEIMVYRLE